MLPISTYTETRIEGTNRYRLFEDRIEAEIDDDTSCSFAVIDLAELDESFRTVRRFGALFYGGLVALAIPGIGLAYHILFAGKDPMSEAMMRWWSLGLCGLLVFLIGLQRNTFAVLQSLDGQPVLSLCLDRAQKDEFEAFVAAIQEEIVKCRGLEEGGLEDV